MVRASRPGHKRKKGNARIQKKDRPTIQQVIEVVWAFREWTDPDLGSPQVQRTLH